MSTTLFLALIALFCISLAITSYLAFSNPKPASSKQRTSETVKVKKDLEYECVKCGSPAYRREGAKNGGAALEMRKTQEAHFRGECVNCYLVWRNRATVLESAVRLGILSHREMFSILISGVLEGDDVTDLKSLIETYGENPEIDPALIQTFQEIFSASSFFSLLNTMKFIKELEYDSRQV